MQPDRLENSRPAAVHAIRPVLAGLFLLAAATCALAATPEPLPPPPELLEGGGYAIDAHTPQAGFSTPGDAPYDPYGTPASAYLPPLPGQPVSEIDQPAGQPAFTVPYMQPPPMAALPPQPVPFMPTPYMPVPSGQFQASPPAAYMPEDYFNLPMNHENDVIPGVLMPTVNEDFYDPAWVPPSRRIIRQGMSQRQLEPFFELAKGSEKAALDAKAANDDIRYRDELQKAVDGYMEIIAMADAGNEAREEAWYGVARCEYRRENWWKSFDAIERSFPREFDRAEVAGRIKLEMFIGERLWRMGRNPVPDARKDGGTLTGYQAASRVYAAAIFNQPNSSDAPLALLRRGDAAAMEEDWEEAAKFYRSVVQHYPESEPAMQARSSLAEAVHRQEWPAGLPEAARDDLNSMMTRVEATERKLSVPAEDRRRRAATLANNHEAETMLRQAKDYLSQIKLKKSRDAAVFLLGNIVSNYPSTPQAWEAADLLTGMGITPPMTLAEGNRYPIAGGVERLEVDRTGGTGAARLNRAGNPGSESAPTPAPASATRSAPMARSAPAVQTGGQPGRRVKRRVPPQPEHSPAPAPQPNPAEVFVPGVTPDWEQ